MKTSDHDLRYERKFLIEAFSFDQIDHIIKFHPACFKEVFHPRNINNIYFDTPAFNNYYDNIEGETDRWKARIRWYGNLFGIISKPTLEFKIKNGLMGHKKSFRINDFSFHKDIPVMETIKASFKGTQIPKDLSDLIFSLKPTLLNRYKRKYLVSADKKYRLTIDSNIEFYSILPFTNTFLNHVKPDYVVVELKYAHQFDPEAGEITKLFPFRLTKSSKYLVGLEKVLL